jgi:ATP-dependent Clp protease adaptor protein ClpS
MSNTVAVPKAKTVAKTERSRLHKVILFNDDYTPRDVVVTVLKTEFRLGEGRAQAVMLTAHRLGSCVVAVYARDVAETKAARATEAARSRVIRYGSIASPKSRIRCGGRPARRIDADWFSAADQGAT